MSVSEKIVRWFELCERLRIPPEHMIAAYRETESYHRPAPVPGSGEAVIAAKYAEICEIVNSGEPGIDFGNTGDLMQSVGLDRHNRSDSVRLSKLLKSNPELERSYGSGWLKRIAH